MGRLRDQFWELPLDKLGREEWEALCDGCGRCCLHKLEDADSGEVTETNVACKLLDTENACCGNYAHRKAFVPDCLRLTPRVVKKVAWLPKTCAYRLRGDDQPIPDWHPLRHDGSKEPMIAAKASVAGRCISENVAGPIENHIIEWDDT